MSSLSGSRSASRSGSPSLSTSGGSQDNHHPGASGVLGGGKRGRKARQSGFDLDGGPGGDESDSSDGELEHDAHHAAGEGDLLGLDEGDEVGKKPVMGGDEGHVDGDGDADEEDDDLFNIGDTYAARPPPRMRKKKEVAVPVETAAAPKNGYHQRQKKERVKLPPREKGRVAIPLPIAQSKPYSLAPHLAKLSRLGSYTYSALTGTNPSTSPPTSKRSPLSAPSGLSALGLINHQAGPTPAHLVPGPDEGKFVNGELDEQGEEDLLRGELEDAVREDERLTSPRMGGAAGLMNGNGHGNDEATGVGGGRMARRKSRLGGVRQRSKFEKIYLGDGKARQCLLLINPTPAIAVQIWDVSASLPSGSARINEAQYEADLLQAQSAAANPTTVSSGGVLSSLLLKHAPKEVACLCEVAVSGGGESTRVLDAVVLPTKGRKAEKEGVLVAVVSLKEREDAEAVVSVALVQLGTGKAVAEREVSEGRDAEVHVSAKAVVVSVASSSGNPSIHVLSPSDLQPVIQPLTSSLGVSTSTGLPIVALSGRLLAFATRKVRYREQSPDCNQAQGHGAIVTKHSVREAQKARARQGGQGWQSSNGNAGRDGVHVDPSVSRRASAQSALWDVAAGLSGEVAKGVWGGLKGLSSAAMTTAGKSTILSKSAPVSSFLGGWQEKPQASHDGHGPRRVSDGIDSGPPIGRKKGTHGGSWIEILDLSRVGSSGDEAIGSVVASFSLPTSHSSGSSDARHPNSNVGCLAFNSLGTHLAVFPEDGRIGSVVEIRPRPVPSNPGAARDMGEVWLRYELLRGVTPSTVISMKWNERDDLLGVATHETIHFYAIHPEGGKPAIQQYQPGLSRNIVELQPLSSRTGASFRVRPLRQDASSPNQVNGTHYFDDEVNGSYGDCSPHGSFTFTASEPGSSARSAGSNGDSPHASRPFLQPPVLCYDPSMGLLSYFDFSLAASSSTDRSQSPLSASEDRFEDAPSGRVSRTRKALDRAVDSMKWKSTIRGNSHLHRRWLLVNGDGVAPADLYLAAQKSQQHRRHNNRSDFFAAAEIRSASVAPKLLPPSLYRSKNTDFVSLRDPPFRLAAGGTRGDPLVFRTVTETTYDEAEPVDGNLSSALGSEMDADLTSPVLPALPNGDRRNKWAPPRQNVLTAAKDIVKLRRRSSQHSDEVASSFGERLALDEETGFLYEAAEEEGHTPQESHEGSLHDEWEDDLIMGGMDGIQANKRLI